VTMIDGPQLNWGYLSRWWREPHEGGSTPTDLARIWQVAADSLDLVVDRIERFELACTLNSHPGHLRFHEAEQPFPAIFALAVASRTATEPLASQSRATAAAALLPCCCAQAASSQGGQRAASSRPPVTSPAAWKTTPTTYSLSLPSASSTDRTPSTAARL
jgi:hypothetical protein